LIRTHTNGLGTFRNRGIAHLTPEKMLKSITLGELRALIAIISRLATTLQHLWQVQGAFRSDMLDEYRELAKRNDQALIVPYRVLELAH
jgi:hypothetical protein